ncbi:helix-turn-helix domain-containing protein [Coprothermobacter platensis]|uniref:helix-turn-helix domain-containing protein n=1 Tax=Coprothermobacter platensis TaxID=108819 RepID=UPI00036FA0D1|nr:helix-turn-helix transcriptional regulator [Coprothermobacter platensis]
MTFGEKLTALRKQQGLSQEDLAEKLSVSRQAISRWESDSTLPDAENLLEISKLFGVTADYLINNNYESDKDLPVVNQAVNEAERSLKLSNAYILAVASITVFTLLGVGLWVLQQNIISVIVSAIGDVLTFAFYELAVSKHVEANKRAWTTRFLRTAIWFAMFFPGLWIVSRFMLFYPRPYTSLTLWAICIAVYLVVCSLTTFVFAKR